MGYWNKIRVDFPETFERMALIERDIGHAIIKDDYGPVYLDELDPKRGRFEKEKPMVCDLLCKSVLQEKPP